MKIAPILLLLSVVGSAAAAAPARDPAMSASLFRLWGKALKPAPGQAEPIGSYSAGCLAGAAELPQDGPGYSVMRLSRKRYFGHPELITYIQDLGATLKAEGMPLLLVGDLGRPRGGPMLSGHASHQIGLDVDLWYHLSHKRPSKKDRERWGATNLVKKDGKMHRLWTDQQRKLVRLAASAESVDRIFVHAGIKRDLCQKFPDAPWLGKLRPWWGHADHLHVRLKCPAGSAECQAQDALPAGDTGCGTELAWWFSDEAREEGAKKSAAHAGRQFPALPESCGRLVAEFQGVKK